MKHHLKNCFKVLRRPEHIFYICTCLWFKLQCIWVWTTLRQTNLVPIILKLFHFWQDLAPNPERALHSLQLRIVISDLEVLILIPAASHSTGKWSSESCRSRSDETNRTTSSAKRKDPKGHQNGYPQHLGCVHEPNQWQRATLTESNSCFVDMTQCIIMAPAGARHLI